MLGQRRLFTQTDGGRRQGTGRTFNAIGREALKNGITIALERIDAQVERCRLVQGARQGQYFIGSELGCQTLVQPIRQITAHGRGKVGFRHRFGCGQPFFLARLEHGGQFALAPAARHSQRNQQQATVGNLTGTACFQTTAAAQHGKNRFGDKGPVGMTQLTIFAEIARNNGISRVVEAQQLAENGFSVGEQGGSETSFHHFPKSTAVGWAPRVLKTSRVSRFGRQADFGGHLGIAVAFLSVNRI